MAKIDIEALGEVVGAVSQFSLSPEFAKVSPDNWLVVAGRLDNRRLIRVK